MSTKSGYVAIIGKPNAGKSTLMNALMGLKLSIVTDKPQTTRKRVLGIYSDADTQIIFLDTPGILKPRYELQRSMMKYVDDAAEEADILAVMIDLPKYIEDPENYFSQEFLEIIQKIKRPKVLLINKIDLTENVKSVLPVIEETAKTGYFDDIVPISALKASNLDQLTEALEKHLPKGPFYYDPELLSTQPQKFFVSEIIREQVFNEYQQEIPYSTEVNVVEFKERETGKWYISAEIIVERGTQKGIIIGAKGSKLKIVGRKSRLEIEEYLQMPVYLDLFVKVREKWRNNKNLLRSYGY